jgi:hypothetical protein
MSQPRKPLLKGGTTCRIGSPTFVDDDQVARLHHMSDSHHTGRSISGYQVRLDVLFGKLSMDVLQSKTSILGGTGFE